MADKNNGWNQPETKFPENELEDSFAGFFSEEEEIEVSNKNKKRRKNKNKSGPDILAVSEEADPGFVITEVVALDTGSEVVTIKEEPAEEETIEKENEETDAQTEEIPENADAHAENELSEEPSEEEEETIVVDLSAKSEEAPEHKKKVFFPNAKRIISKRRTHKYAATIGAVLIALALIGAISVCSALFNLGARVLDNTRQKEAFEWKIYPLLMFDPATFEEPNQLDEVFILKTSLWSALLENRTKYSYDENGMLLVPASDLDVAAKSLYGENVSLKHQTFSEGYEFFYIYSEDTNTYSVPISGQSASYVPKVVEIRKSGSEYTLIVGYVAPTTLWNVSEDGSSESVPDKYMYYVLEKLENGNYIIKSVRSIPEEELPEDLEVSDMKELNQTQYFDYDEIYQDYIDEQVGKAEGVPENTEGEDTAEGEKTAEGEDSGETSSDESSEDTSSDAE